MELTQQHVTKCEAIARKVCGREYAHWADEVAGSAIEAMVKADRQWDGRGEWDGFVWQRVTWRSRDALASLIGRGEARAVKSAESLDVIREREDW